MLSIQRGDITTVVRLSKLLPEFSEPHEATEYVRRMEGKRSLVLIAYWDNQPVGFKVGYQREDYFYSWMGGVLPEWRRKGIARALSKYMEEWASQSGFRRIRFKTRNRHKYMLCFAILNGFDIIEVEARNEIGEFRLFLEKKL